LKIPPTEVDSCKEKEKLRVKESEREKERKTKRQTDRQIERKRVKEEKREQEALACGGCSHFYLQEDVRYRAE
jgi:hypothetical protein